MINTGKRDQQRALIVRRELERFIRTLNRFPGLEVRFALSLDPTTQTYTVARFTVMRKIESIANIEPKEPTP